MARATWITRFALWLVALHLAVAVVAGSPIRAFAHGRQEIDAAWMGGHVARPVEPGTIHRLKASQPCDDAATTPSAGAMLVIQLLETSLETREPREVSPPDRLALRARSPPRA